LKWIAIAGLFCADAVANGSDALKRARPLGHILRQTDNNFQAPLASNNQQSFSASLGGGCSRLNRSTNGAKADARPNVRFRGKADIALTCPYVCS
jgi:hypothetical protein